MEAQSRRHDGWLAAASIVAVVFGLLTVTEGGHVLFGGEEARRAAGAYVPYVLWFNFIAGFAYIAAGAGLWAGHRAAAALAFTIAGATLFTYLMFGVHIATGGAYEERTVFAMALRSAVWVAISFAAYRGAWRATPRPAAR